MKIAKKILIPILVIGILFIIYEIYFSPQIFDGNLIVREYTAGSIPHQREDDMHALYVLSPLAPGVFDKGKRITPEGINAGGVYKIVNHKLLFTCSDSHFETTWEGVCRVDLDGDHFERLATMDELDVDMWGIKDIFPDGSLLYIEQNDIDHKDSFYRIGISERIKEYIVTLPFEQNLYFYPPLISPNGKLIALVDPEHWEINILDIESTEITVIGDGANVVWSADNQNIGYIRIDDDNYRIKYIVFSFSEMDIVKEVVIKEYLCARGNLTGNSDLSKIYFQVACGESDSINGLTYLNAKTGRVKFDIVFNQPYGYYPTDPYWFP